MPTESIATSLPRRDAASSPHRLTTSPLHACPRFRYAIVSWDQTLRDHVGGHLRKLFPRLPDRGRGKTKVLGDNRSFSDSLKWTASNSRKTMNTINKSYKAKIVAPRAALSDRAVNLVDQKSYPLKLESDDVSSLGSFEKGVFKGVSNFLNREGACTCIQTWHCHYLVTLAQLLVSYSGSY